MPKFKLCIGAVALRLSAGNNAWTYERCGAARIVGCFMKYCDPVTLLREQAQLPSLDSLFFQAHCAALSPS